MPTIHFVGSWPPPTALRGSENAEVNPCRRCIQLCVLGNSDFCRAIVRRLVPKPMRAPGPQSGSMHVEQKIQPIRCLRPTVLGLRHRQRPAHLKPTSPACLVPKLSGLLRRSASRLTDSDVVKLPFQTLESGNSAVGMTVAVTVVQPRGIYEPAAIRWDFAPWDSAAVCTGSTAERCKVEGGCTKGCQRHQRR
jgi:hypothetical protein